MISLDHIIQLLEHYKYLILFPISVVEGPIITILGGFLASLGQLNLWVVLVIVILGDIVGDTIYYFVGMSSRNAFSQKLMKFLRITPQRLASLDEHFAKHTGKTLLFGKFTHAFGTVVLLGAGAARIKYPKFIFYNIIGTIPKSLVLVLVGYYFGQAYDQINRYLDLGSYAIVLAGIIIVAVYIIFLKLSKRLVK